MPGFNIGGTGGTVSNLVETARRHRFEWTLFSPASVSGNQSSGGSAPAISRVGQVLVFCHKAGRPVIEIDRIKMSRGQDEIFVPGKQHWSPCEISFYEAVRDDNQITGNMVSNGCDTDIRFGVANAINAVADIVHEWWAVNTINIRRSRLQRRYKAISHLSMLDGGENTIWKYQLYGCWPSKVTPVDLDYGESAIAEISVTLSYDKADEKWR
jgi:hypothetical protein